MTERKAVHLFVFFHQRMHLLHVAASTQRETVTEDQLHHFSICKIAPSNQCLSTICVCIMRSRQQQLLYSVLASPPELDVGCEKSTCS